MVMIVVAVAFCLVTKWLTVPFHVEICYDRIWYDIMKLVEL